jgi:hypothetical protein
MDSFKVIDASRSAEVDAVVDITRGHVGGEADMEVGGSFFVRFDLSKEM